MARIDYHRWRRLATPLLLVSLGFLLLVLVPGVGVGANGATRWIGVGSLTFQPAELAKFALLVWVADLLARRAAFMHNTRATLRPVVVVLAVMATLVMLQPNLGTTIVLAAIALTLCFVAGAPLGPLAAWAALGIGAATTLALAAPYRRSRVLTFLDPWADPMDKGYQNIQALVGVASGGFFGRGLGASRAKWGFLPYAHTDFIFAIIGEELGLVGAAVVVGLFVLLVIIGIRVALHAPDRFGLLLADRCDGLVRCAGVRQHRCRDRHPPHHRGPAPVRERRRLIAAVHDGSRRCAALGRRQARATSLPPRAPASGRGRCDAVATPRGASR